MPFATATGVAAAAVTLTLPANGSARAFIQWLLITMYATAAKTGGATPITVTTTNMDGLAFTFPSAAAVGTVVDRLVTPSQEAASQATGTTTVVCPATASVIWRISCYYDYG